MLEWIAVVPGMGAANNLREIERIISNGVEDKVLKLVDRPEKVFTQCSHSCDII